MMNREEAIEKWVIPALKNTWNEKRCNEVLEALEQEPCDAVNRKAAIDACLKGLNRKEMVANIKALPSVTPAESEQLGMRTDDKCKECKKDWTKCGRCPVTMEWVKEHKSEVQDADRN